MKKLLCLFLLILQIAYAQKIDFVSNFNLQELVKQQHMMKDTGLTIRYFRDPFRFYLDQFYTPEIEKVFMMGTICAHENFPELPPEKCVLFLWEPVGGRQGDLENDYSRIYTFNDDVIDGKKFFKFYYPVLRPMINSLPDFEKKKFCVLMTHTYTREREQLIRFFEKKPSMEFDYFGFRPIIKTSRYRGKIPGHPLSREKLNVLKYYRFCICFENSYINGYITEKIFTCFSGGCIPVYLGAPNIEEYIPKDCFIDYRDFSSDEELYQYLISMSKEEHEGYLKRIRNYLESEKAKLFSPKHFHEIVLECVNSDIVNEIKK